MDVFELDDGTLSLEGNFPHRGFGGAGCHYDYSKFSITKCHRLPARFARALTQYSKVERLWIWCDVYRTAMPYVLSSPVLKVLDILCISRPGKRMPSFDCAPELEEFRCNIGLIESDLVAISKAPNLRELGAQSSQLTSTAIDSLLKSSKLEALDLECAGVTDSMAEQLGNSQQILSLELGNNPITGKGLRGISKMSQLQRLDLWLTDTTAKDIEVLANLRNLEYISVGGVRDEREMFSGEDIIPVLKLFPSLKSVWLDGVTLSSEQTEELNERYEIFRN